MPAIGQISRRERQNIAIALGLSVLVHCGLLSWRVPYHANRFGDTRSVQPAIKATLLGRAPSSVKTVPAPLKVPSPVTPPVETVPPIAAPISKADTSPSVPVRRRSRKAEPIERILQAPEFKPDPEPVSRQINVADRDASVSDDDLQALRDMVKGVGRIRFHLVVNRAGRVEEVTVETTDIPPQLELAVTRRLFSTPFLPAYRTGAPTSSPLTLDLEPQ